MLSIILRTTLTLALFLSPTIESVAWQSEGEINQSDMVYICTGPSSKRYHKSSSCQGLKRCSDTIEKVSKSKAQAQGKTPCKICY